MNESTRVRDFIRVVVGLNLVTLVALFIAPRFLYLGEHWEKGHEGLLRLEGVWDQPNIYRESFVLAEEIRLETPKNARIFFPGSRGVEMDPAPLIKTLYPRRLFFKGSPGYENKLREARKISRSWKVVPANLARLCRKKSLRRLGDTGFWICRLDR